MIRRLALLLAASAVAIVLAEGLLSLLARRSLHGLFSPPIRSSIAPGEAERIAAAARVPGHYRVHVDPRVGFTTKASSRLEMLGVEVETDDLGMRVRPGPPAAADAIRIVLLGDSIAFGLGLRGDQVIGHVLEELLRDVRGAGARQVCVSTVATPGWNHRNATAFLGDHMNRYRPDLVVFLPVDNDLGDTYGVTEAGHRRAAHDGFAPSPGLQLYADGADGAEVLILNLSERIARGEIDRISAAELGPSVLRSDLTPESSIRFDAMAAELLDLHDRLVGTGGRLVLLPYDDDPFHLHLRARLVRAGASIPVVPGLDEPAAEDTLGFNAHPNPATARALAIWLAEELLELGLIDPVEDIGLPAVPADVAGRRAPRIQDHEVPSRAAQLRSAARRQLSRRIETATGRGLLQVFGGLSREARIGSEFLAVLPAGADSAELTVQAIADRPDLYPLDLTIEVDGRWASTVTLDGVTDQGIARHRFPLQSGADGAPHEIRIRAHRLAVVDESGRSVLASCQFHSLRTP